ncbi:MAG: hypothetical protein WC059_00540 [Candidatus Paceibacterota bacterium]
MRTATQESPQISEEQKERIEHYFKLRDRKRALQATEVSEAEESQILEIKKDFPSLSSVFIDDSFYWATRGEAIQVLQKEKPLMRELFSGRRPVMILYLSESGTKMANVLFAKEGNASIDEKSVLYPITVKYAIFKDVCYALLVPHDAQIVSEN